jgi:hypothetical protein
MEEIKNNFLISFFFRLLFSEVTANDSAALRSFHRKPCFHEKILQKYFLS